MTTTAVDNDVLIKLAAYRLLDDGLGMLGDVSVLGAALYVVPNAIARHERLVDRATAIEHWVSAAERVEALEPSAEELELASRIEERALRSGLPMDAGESQLFAIAARRAFDLLVTGDKRAINSAERLRDTVVDLGELDARVLCLEQVVLRLVAVLGGDVVKAAICSEPGADRAVSICMQCAIEGYVGAACHEALLSYVADVRRSAPLLLADN